MSALVERIIAARDVLKARRHDFYSLEVLDAMADAANALDSYEKIASIGNQFSWATWCTCPLPCDPATCSPASIGRGSFSGLSILGREVQEAGGRPLRLAQPPPLTPPCSPT